MGSDALQPKVPRRKVKLAEHRKQRKLKAKGRSRPAAEEGADPVGVTSSLSLHLGTVYAHNAVGASVLRGETQDHDVQTACRPHPVHGGVV